MIVVVSCSLVSAGDDNEERLFVQLWDEEENDGQDEDEDSLIGSWSFPVVDLRSPMRQKHVVALVSGDTNDATEPEQENLLTVKASSIAR